MPPQTLLNKTHDGDIPAHLHLGDYQLLRKILSTKDAQIYSALGKDGNRYTVTVWERGLLMDRLRYLSYQRYGEYDKAQIDGEQYYQELCREQYARFQRVEGLAHPRLCAAVHAGLDVDTQQMMVISEHAPGIDIMHAAAGYTPLQTIHMLYQLLEALDYVHSHRLLHLHIKPRRVRVDLEGTRPEVRLLDFGLAVPMPIATGTALSGSPHYMAPEVIQHQYDRIDQRADLYGFAALAYHCLTKRVPHPNRNTMPSLHHLQRALEGEHAAAPPIQLCRDIPKELNEILLELLHPDPDQRRFQRADQLLSEFIRYWPNECTSMPVCTTSTLVEYWPGS